MTPKHTPTPWEMIINKNDNGKSISAIALANSQEVFTHLIYKPGVYHPDGWKGFRKEHIANAAFIVRACNSHEELIEVIKRIVDISDNRPEDMYDEEGFPTWEWNEIMQSSRAALARAEGKV